MRREDIVNGSSASEGRTFDESLKHENADRKKTTISPQTNLGQPNGHSSNHKWLYGIKVSGTNYVTVVQCDNINSPKFLSIYSPKTEQNKHTKK